jgi:mono/diheme cytochrome c family protein
MTLKRLMRWSGVALAGVALAVFVGGMGVYGASEYMLRQSSPDKAAAIDVPSDVASIAEGKRLSFVHGCLSCHGPSAEGNVLFDEPLIARIVAPNLTYSIRHHSTADIITAIRKGVRPDDGTTMIVMPSQAFAPLSDSDLGHILGYLASLPPSEGPESGISIGPIGRVGLLIGKYQTSLQLVERASPPPEATDAETTLGRYLARTSCAQCHAADLGGAEHPEGVAPSLRVVAAYSPEDFATLMRTGVGSGGRKLGVMTGWAAMNFSNFTSEEVRALYRYLHGMPEAGAR